MPEGSLRHFVTFTCREHTSLCGISCGNNDVRRDFLISIEFAPAIPSFSFLFFRLDTRKLHSSVKKRFFLKKGLEYIIVGHGTRLSSANPATGHQSRTPCPPMVLKSGPRRRRRRKRKKAAAEGVEKKWEEEEKGVV